MAEIVVDCVTLESGLEKALVERGLPKSQCRFGTVRFIMGFSA